MSETRGARIMCCGPESCTPHTFPASIGCPQRSARIRGCGPESCTSHTFPASIGCPQRGSPWRRRHTGIAAPMRFFVMNCSRICSHPARLRKGLQVAVGACHKGFKWLLAREFQCRSGKEKKEAPLSGPINLTGAPGQGPVRLPGTAWGPFKPENSSAGRKGHLRWQGAQGLRAQGSRAPGASGPLGPLGPRSPL